MAAFFTACQPELVSTEPVHQNTINVTLDSWQHIESKYPKVANNIKQLKQQAQLNRYSSNYNFYINDSTVQVIEQPNYTTFTFFVYRDSLTPNILENYTYKLYNDGTYQQFLLKYHYTLDQDLNKVFSQTHFDIEAIDDHSLLYGRTNSCIPEFETVQTGVVCTVATKCTGTRDGHGVGDTDCKCQIRDLTCERAGNISCNPTYTVVYNSCGGGTNNEPDPNQNTNTTQGGNTQDPNSEPDPNNNSTIATPLEDTTPAWQVILDCINNPNLLETDTTTLDPDIFESLGLSKATYQAITNYLDENQCSERAQNFVIEAFHAILNNGEVDFEDRLIVDSSFKNNTKAKCVYDRMKSLNGTVFSNLLSMFDNSTTTQLTLSIENIPQTNPSFYKKALTLPRFGGGNLSSTKIVLDSQFVQNASLIEIALALVHEMIHAEIMERCIRLGIITAINYDSNYEVRLNFSGTQIITNNNTNLLFSFVVDKYTSFSDPNNAANPNWQHELFSILNYRNQITTNLLQLHPLLDDPHNTFENNLNSNAIIDITLGEFFELITWLSLDGTQEYNNLSALELTKLSQAKNQMELYYNSECN